MIKKVLDQLPTYSWGRGILLFLLALILWWVGLMGESPGIAAELESPPEVSATFTGMDATQIASEKVNQFTTAYLQVLRLIERRQVELQATETDSESRRLQQDIETEALKLIEQAGLTLQEYVQLLNLANTDPEFGERVATHLQESVMP